MIFLFLAAAFWGFENVIETLLDSGCNVNHQNEGSLWTPLHAATFQEHVKVMVRIPGCIFMIRDMQKRG